MRNEFSPISIPPLPPKVLLEKMRKEAAQTESHTNELEQHMLSQADVGDMLDVEYRLHQYRAAGYCVPNNPQAAEELIALAIYGLRKLLVSRQSQCLAAWDQQYAEGAAESPA